MYNKLVDRSRLFLKDFLQGLLQKQSSKRLSWPNLLYHSFVVEGTCAYNLIILFYLSSLTTPLAPPFSPSAGWPHLYPHIGLDLDYLSQCAQEGEMVAMVRPTTAISSNNRVKSAPPVQVCRGDHAIMCHHSYELYRGQEISKIVQ